MFPVIPPDDVPSELKIRAAKIPCGEKLEGWICGKIVIAVTHWSGNASKPCVHAMSSGALHCYCLDGPAPTRKLGYLPLITQKGERVCVILSSGVAAQMSLLLHATPVVLRRSRVPKSALAWYPWSESSLYSLREKNVQRSPKVDISRWLLGLWGNDELRRFYTPELEAPADPPPPPAVNPTTSGKSSA